MLLFTDDVTGDTDEFVLKLKLEALEKFRECNALREKELSNPVMRFRTDGGGEYTSKKFAEYHKSEGIYRKRL
jgi:hypothetical protein